jgi:hypothetical protein
MAMPMTRMTVMAGVAVSMAMTVMTARLMDFGRGTALGLAVGAGEGR